MLTVFDTMRGMTIESVFLRLTLAVLFGGLIGMERNRKKRGQSCDNGCRALGIGLHGTDYWSLFL